MNVQPSIDLTTCDKEAIHLLGKIQTFGHFLALSPDWQFMAVSDNVLTKLALKSEEILGCLANSILDESFIFLLKEVCPRLESETDSEYFFKQRVFAGIDEAFDVTVKLTGGQICLDLESAVHNNPLQVKYMRRAIHRFSTAENIAELHQVAAEEFATLLGFDRTMIYFFHPDNSGEVIAEECKLGVDSFMGLYFPASDIPQQARILYKKNLIRLIADVSDEGVAIVGPDQIDLSYSGLRHVSPIHLEYLQNMGVRASMSLSILVNDQLWGLVALHNNSTRYIPLESRVMSEVLVETYAHELNHRIRQQENSLVEKSKSMHLTMMSSLNSEHSLLENLKAHLPGMLKLINCDTVVVNIQDKYIFQGKAISEEDVKILVNHFNRMVTTDIFYTDHLSAVMNANLTINERFSGYLVIPISRKPRDYIIFLRCEMLQSVTWSGNPEKPVEYGPNGARLSPRKSFAAWEALKVGYSREWTQAEINLAKQFKVTMMEIIIRNIDERDQFLSTVEKEQNILVSELNHRVRNILNLVSGVISQTGESISDISEFKDVLGGRIQSLSKAQNILNKHNWRQSPLQELVQNNIDMFGNEIEVTVAGPDVFLAPKAFTNMSLILHELMTNAIKHGAYKHNGALFIRWRILPNGNLEFNWLEKGIIFEETPIHEGFGSMIIRRSVPYELDGTADIDYTSHGLDVRYEIPKKYVSQFVNGAIESKREVKKAIAPRSFNRVATYNILVVEDNMIIAIDIENILRTIGFVNIYTVGSVKDALNVIAHHNIDIALLDINLGHETSFNVAKKLQDYDCLFMFVTGYSEYRHEMSQDFPDNMVISKPLDKAKLEYALLKLFAN